MLLTVLVPFLYDTQLPNGILGLGVFEFYEIWLKN